MRLQRTFWEPQVSLLRAVCLLLGFVFEMFVEALGFSVFFQPLSSDSSNFEGPRGGIVWICLLFFGDAAWGPHFLDDLCSRLTVLTSFWATLMMLFLVVF